MTIENTRIPETVTPVPPTPPTPSQPTVPLQPLTPAVPTQTLALERGVMGEEQVQDQPIASSLTQTPTDQVTLAPALQRGFLAETQYSVPTKKTPCRSPETAVIQWCIGSAGSFFLPPASSVMQEEEKQRKCVNQLM